MNKVFAKSRVCAINAYPSIEKGINQAILFAKQFNITLNTKDGKNLIYGFCVKQLQEDYEKTQSNYNKVFFMQQAVPNKRLEKFINNYFESMIKKSSFPYCGRYNVDSPDLETAAQNCTTKHPNFTQKRFQQFLQTIKPKPKAVVY